MKDDRWNSHGDHRLQKALKAALLARKPQTAAAQFAQDVFRRVLGEEESGEAQ